MLPVVDIRLIREPDISLVSRYFTKGTNGKHKARFLRQQTGEALYLIGWIGERPVSHALLTWGGSKDQAVKRNLSLACPDVGDLMVAEDLRSQGIGSQMLAFAEQLVRERGYNHIGLSVGIENERARQLYERLGYHDAHCGEHIEQWQYLDAQGQAHTEQETCIYLIKELQAADS